MKHALLILGVAVSVLGCGRGEPPSVPATVRLTVAPMWAGAPFDKNIIYTNISDERIQVQLLKFYLGDLTMRSGSDSVRLFDVDLFTLTNGPITRTYQARSGDFDHVRVGLGVPAALNGSSPSMWANSDPLSITNGMYWTWATMYRFMIFEGRFDTLSTGIGTPPYQFSIHTGRNECYRTRSFPVNLSVAGGDTTDIRLELDLSHFFYSTTDTLYMATESQQHGSIGELPMSQKFSGMVMDAMSLQP